MRRPAFILLLFFFGAADALAATYVSIATGNWGTASTWAILRTGAITSSTASTTVTGSGTLFSTELAAGNVLYTATGVAIGTVKTITNATTLTLTGNAASTNGGIAYYATTAGTPSAAADVATINSPHTVTGNVVTSIAFVAINTGGTLSEGNNLTTSGALNVGGTFTMTGGTMSFGGAVTITGTWNNSGNRAVTLQGGLTNNGTFTSGTNTYTFSLNAQSIAGGSAITFNGIVSIANNLVVTNQNTNIVRIVGNLTGGNGSSTWINAANSTLQVEGTVLTTGTLTASASGNTVNYAGTVAQTVKLPSGTPATYYNLTLSGAATKTMPATAMTITNNFTVSGTTSATAGQALTIGGAVSIGTGSTFNGGTFSHSVAGNWTNSGTFTATAGTITFNGSAAQTLTGSTGFFNVTVSNSSGVTLAASPASDITLAATGTLILTNGLITTNANTIITPRACNAPSVTRTNGWVNGNLRKAIPLGLNVICTFEIGDASKYAPAIFTFASVTTAGNLTGVTVGGTDHPQIASSGIDSLNSVNRYWTFTNAGVAFSAAGYSANFNFFNGSPADVDNLGSVASYTVEQWDGSSWFPMSVGASCTAIDANHLCKTINSETAFGDFAIGGFQAGINGIPGSFNTFEGTASTTQILGRIFTKVAGTSFMLPIVAITTTNFTRNTAPAATALTVEILDGSSTGGTLTAATNCRTTWTSVQSQTVTPTWTSGSISVTINAPAQAVRDARIRVTQGALIGCSTDRFSVRPAAFAISSSASNSATFGTPTVKTGAFFTMSAQPVTSVSANITVGYDGTPSFDLAQVVGSPNAGALAGGPFSAATGGATSASNFYYSEVGNFGLNANAVIDTGFTGVDQAAGDCNVGGFSNTADGAGKFGCSIGQAAIAVSSGFGRFIPDNFSVSLNTPQFGPACTLFSYVGQTFLYATKPIITVTARNGTTNGLANATTLNYAGSYMKFVNTAGQSLNKTPYDTQAARYIRFDALGGGTTPALDTSSLPATTSDPTIGTFTNGVGTLTFSNGANDALAFTRSATTPSGPFNADLSLELNVIDSDNVALASNPAKFSAATAGNGIAFTSGNKAFRYGVIRLLDVFAPLAGNSSGFAPVGIQAQYWTAAAGLQPNTLDNCTSFTEQNFVLYGHAGSIKDVSGPGYLPTPTLASNGKVSMGVATLVSGVGRVNVISTSSNPAPVSTITQPGSVKICLDLDSSSAPLDNSCVAVTPANKAYLQGRWSGANYDKDPNATVGFGLYGSQPKNFIYFRENY